MIDKFNGLPKTYAIPMLPKCSKSVSEILCVREGRTYYFIVCRQGDVPRRQKWMEQLESSGAKVAFVRDWSDVERVMEVDAHV